MTQSTYDAVVIGSGSNGLAAAIAFAQAGKSVAVFEANETLGGGVRSAEQTLPGFVHDICSSIYPRAVRSPFFATLPLTEHGLEWVQPNAALAQPLDDGTAMVLGKFRGSARSQTATPKALRTWRLEGCSPAFINAGAVAMGAVTIGWRRSC